MRALPHKTFAATAIMLAVVAFFSCELSRAQTLTTLYQFKGRPDGEWPFGVVRDSKGNLYGTTLLGGRKSAGTVFELSASGKETILHSFSGNEGEDPWCT
jgi:uncharacterized repeat protein (TIGR03803 family)